MTRLMRTPKSVDIDITNRCNLRCAYCYHFDSPGDVDSDLSTDQWLRFFEELGRCAVMEVCLAGGEPFVRKDLKQLIDGIVTNHMRFQILSNGTLLTDDMAAYLSATKRCNSVQVSIDGATPSSHDACRGEGTFMKAVGAINILRRHGISVAVRVTIHRHNVYDLDNIARFLLEEVGLPGFSTNSAGYMGLCRKNNEHVSLTPGERSHAMRALLDLAERYNGRISAAAGPLAEARMWTEMERARREGGEISNRGYLRACGGMWSKLAVRADGVMVPCNMMSHIPLGTINRDDMADVWQNHEALWRVRNRRDIALSEFEFCAGCDYIPYCTGNCPGLAYTLTGKDEHPSPDACLKRFLEAGGELP